MAVPRVSVDDLPRGAELAYPRQARQGAPAGAAAELRQPAAQHRANRTPLVKHYGTHVQRERKETPSYNIFDIFVCVLNRYDVRARLHCSTLTASRTGPQSGDPPQSQRGDVEGV